MHGMKSVAIALVSIIAAARLMADCSPTVVVQVPVTACKSGTATAAVLSVPGASYAWTVDGGTLAGSAVVTAPATRQRAVSKSPVTASTCSAAHMVMPYLVDACADPPVIVDGPSSVVVGTSFQLTVRSQPGAFATWTIANGSPSA